MHACIRLSSSSFYMSICVDSHLCGCGVCVPVEVITPVDRFVDDVAWIACAHRPIFEKKRETEIERERERKTATREKRTRFDLRSSSFFEIVTDREERKSHTDTTHLPVVHLESQWVDRESIDIHPARHIDRLPLSLTHYTHVD